MNEPVVHQSAGSGSAFVIWSSSGTEIQNLAIFRSDNGNVLCSRPGAVRVDRRDEGRAGHADDRDHSFLGREQQSDHDMSAPARKLPDHAVVAAVLGRLHIGGCPFTPSTKQFLIKNNGTDCLTVNPIGSSARRF